VKDIDDTIKVTKVRDRMELLKHTFALEPEAVENTPALYERLNTVLEPAWFYLSASPYNLYPVLSSFVSANYPQGQLLLREMSWQELESFIVSLTVGTQQYKEKELERLVKRLPERKWVFIGDSTQKDPESYATTYKKFPQAVKRIWIRVVEGVNEAEEKKLNSKERFRKAFKDVPSTVWRTYKEASELDCLVAEIV
jgi:phosphatidate phosphatase APP1